MNEILTCVCAAGAALCALILLFLKNIFHAGLTLGLCMIFIACLFGLRGAEFLAVTQLLIYTGGAVSLILFGVMITNTRRSKSSLKTHYIFPALLIAALMAVLLYKSYRPSPAASQTIALRETGFSLFSAYAAPFEWTGFLLLVCLVGATAIASKQKS
ncbi:MAG: hypothetical protein CRN43_15635 [Candidatus Nephrothrix sp. EaCA]|nr:MAG: hypothetical protein CRN43_15635 [Candidatus Nephrothrix sp. EaCA]